MTVAELIEALKAMPQSLDVVLVFDSFAPSHPRHVVATTYRDHFYEVVEDWDNADEQIVVID